MKKYFYSSLVLAVLIFGFSNNASADSGLGGFFSYVSGLGEDVWNLATVSTPNMIERMFAYLLQWYITVEFYLLKQALEFSWQISGVVLEDLALGSKLNNAISFLPNDVQAALVQMRILDGIELLLQAYVTRFTFDLIN